MQNYVDFWQKNFYENEIEICLINLRLLQNWLANAKSGQHKMCVVSMCVVAVHAAVAFTDSDRGV